MREREQRLAAVAKRFTAFSKEPMEQWPGLHPFVGQFTALLQIFDQQQRFLLLEL